MSIRRGTGPTVRRRGRSGSTQLTFETLEPRHMLSVNVLTYHNDLTRQGLNPAEEELTPANVNSSTFGELFTYPVQGQVYAQPLYVSNLVIPGQGTHNVVFVATENNDVYAFDADSNAGPNGGLLWHVNLGLAAVVPNPYFGNRYGPYHDINPQIGITSTPVIDLATNTMYIDAFTNDVPLLDVFSHHIWALDITTGQEKAPAALVVASVAGNSPGSENGIVSFDAKQQLQRPALTLVEGVLYVAYAGYADTDPYNGWVLGFDAATLDLVKVFNTTPNGDGDTNEGEGGIWQTGNGLAYDGTHLYVLTGNGDFEPALGDYGDSFLKIAPDDSTQFQNLNGYGLTVSDFFTPFNEQSLADADADLGSGGVLLLPDQGGSVPHLLVGAGKEGTIYLIDRDNMGQFNNLADNVVQKVSLGAGMFGSPAYFDNKLYFHPTGDVLKAYSISNGQLSSAPIAKSTTSFFYPGATPSVSSNGNANGIVWDVLFTYAHAVLYAYDATNLTELYNSAQSGARDQLGPAVKFATPTIADGRVFVGTDGGLTVFGLFDPPTDPPAAPTNLFSLALGPTQAQLFWSDNSNNESGFLIERSTDNVNFTEITVASVNAHTYIDSTVNLATTYYYRIRATNAVGDSGYSGTTTVVTPDGTGAIDVYHFNEGIGVNTADSAGGNIGTLVGTMKPVWVANGSAGSALSFSGNGVFRSTASQSAVQVASNLAPVLGGTATLATWIKTTQVGGSALWNSPAITGVERASSQDDIRWGYLDPAGHIGIGAGNLGFVSTTAVNDGQWHHVAFTRDSVTGLVAIYVDGVLQRSGTSSTGLKSSPFRLIGAQTDLTIAGGADGATYFNGQLDELRIYDKVLSPIEIAGLALVPTTPTLQTATVSPGPVVHLTFTNPSNYAQNVEIYRKVGAAGVYQKIATLAASATMFDDQDVTPGTHYSYIIKATDLAGSSAASNELSVVPPVPTIVGNFVFYNGSSYDGENGSSNVPDYLAIAPDKVALLPGQTASFENYTSYSKGINGIIIDVANLDFLPRLDDFIFRVGNGSDLSSWTAAPTPTYVNAYPGRGPGGSTQITIIWPDNAIQNEWLEVTMLAEPHLGLLADNVFYFGNAIGETGNSSTNTAVDTADELRTRNNSSELGTVSITNPYDYNRDKHVDLLDVLIARTHRSGLAPLSLITVPSLAGSGSAAKEPDLVEPLAPAVGAALPTVSSLAITSPGSAPQALETQSESQRTPHVDAAMRELYNDSSTTKTEQSLLDAIQRLANLRTHFNSSSELDQNFESSSPSCDNTDAPDDGFATLELHELTSHSLSRSGTTGQLSGLRSSRGGR